MNADAIIAKAAGTLMSRGLPTNQVLEAVDRLRTLAQHGRAITVELHGIRVMLPARTDRQVPRGRFCRA